MGTSLPLLGHVICVNLMEIAKRRQIIWLVRILELKIRKSNNLLLMFFKSEAEWYSSNQELLPHLDGCLVFDPKFKF